MTPTRAWEFGAGALLALMPREDGARPVAAGLLSWLGLAAIAAAALASATATAVPRLRRRCCRSSARWR